MRREKEIAVIRCEASEEEALRHKQRAEHLNQEMMEIQEALNAERERMQVREKGQGRLKVTGLTTVRGNMVGDEGH